jgi:hypothetical protein
MAVLTGYRAPSFSLFAGGFLSPSIDDGLEDNLTERLTGPAPGVTAGALSRILPAVAPGAALTGFRALSFADLWFNRIHVFPAIVDAGNLVFNEVRNVEIWNSFLSASKQISAVTPSGELSGVALNLTPPADFAPLESIVYELTISLSGAPDFAGAFAFTLADATPAPLLLVSGRRIIPIPFRADWSRLPSESLDYLTKVYEADSGMEKRVRFRSAAARRRLSFSLALVAGNDAARNNRLRMIYDALIYGWQNRIFAVPVWMDAVQLGEDLTAGATAIPADALYRDFDAGGYVILWTDETNYEIAEIESVTATEIRTRRPLLNEWPKYRTRIIPARLARTAARVDVDELSGAVDMSSVEFLLETGQTFTNRRAAWTAPVYRGFPVWMRPNSADDSKGREINRKIVRLENPPGFDYVTSKDAAPRARADIAIVLIGRAEIAAFFGWIDDRAGRLKAAWFPTFRRDFELMEVAAAGSNSITVRDIGYSGLVFAGGNRLDVMISLLNGNVYFRRITGAASNGDGTENLTFDSIIPVELSAGNIDRICYLRPARLDSDTVTLEWETTDKARSVYRIIDLQGGL